MSKGNNKNGALLFCLALFIAYAVMPIISLYLPAVIRVVLLLLIIVLLVSDVGFNSFMSYLGKLIPIYLFAIFNLIRLFFVGSDQIVAVTYDLFSMILISCMYFYAVDGKHLRYSRSLLRVVIAIYLITTITTIIGNNIYPEASRMLATGMTGELAMYNMYRAFNIGGFGFVYELVLPVALLPFVFKEKSIPRLVTIGVFLLILYCAYATQFTLALMVALGYGLFFFVGRLKNSRKAISSMVILGTIIILILPAILQFLSASLGSEIMVDRIEGVGSVVSGSDTSQDSDVDQRQSAYMTSISDFLANPLTGTGKNGGGHSYILDNMAKYGILGLLGLIIMMRSIFKLYIKPYSNTEFYGYMILAYIVFLLLTFLNPSPLYMSITFLLPLLAYRLKSDITVK